MLKISKRIIRISHAIMSVIDDKLMQVIVVPPHYLLKDPVQFDQGDIVRHQHATPDSGTGVCQFNAQ